MVEALPILEQLYLIYVEQETWHKERLTKEQFFSYTDKLIRQGNIFFVLDGDRVVGYTEVWRITYEMFGKLLCMERVNASEADVQTGEISYVANIWVAPDYRQGFGRMKGVVKEMRKMYFEFTKDCKYHVGEAKRKATGLVKVFTSKEQYRKRT